jgi:hypothetical protein
MPRWTITLRYWDTRQEVTWEDGELTGADVDFIDLIKMQAEMMEGQPVGPIPTGPFYHHRPPQRLPERLLPHPGHGAAGGFFRGQRRYSRASGAPGGGHPLSWSVLVTTS